MLSIKANKLKYNLSNYTACVSVSLRQPRCKPRMCCKCINIKNRCFSCAPFPTTGWKCSLELELVGSQVNQLALWSYTTYLLLFPLFLFLLLRQSAFFLVQGKYNSIMMHYGLRELGVVYDVFCHSWHNKKHKSSSVIRTGKWPLSAVSTYHLIQLMNALNLKSYEITVVLTVQL